MVLVVARKDGVCHLLYWNVNFLCLFVPILDAVTLGHSAACGCVHQQSVGGFANNKRHASKSSQNEEIFLQQRLQKEQSSRL